MTITKKTEDNNTILCLDGWLDTTTSDLLGKEVEQLNDFSSLTLDFDKLEYISSAGLRQVVVLSKKAKELNANFSIINAGIEVMSVFKLTQLDKKLNIKEKIN